MFNEVEQQDHIEKEISDVFNKKVIEKNQQLKVIEKEEAQKIEVQMKKLESEKVVFNSRKETFEREKLDFMKSPEFSFFQNPSDSLGRRKKFMFSIGTLKFGRQ